MAENYATYWNNNQTTNKTKGNVNSSVKSDKHSGWLHFNNKQRVHAKQQVKV